MLLSFFHEEPPFIGYILQETVPHGNYPSKESFAEYFIIQQHPYQANLTQVTRITNTKEFKDSLKGLISYLEIQQFSASAMDLKLEEGSDLNLSTHDLPNNKIAVNSSEPMSFNEFFIYGEGGRYERDEINGALIFKDKELITKQRHVLSHMIRNIGRNLLTGKSIMNVSMPVHVFDTKSILQTSCSTHGYAPIFLNRAAKASGIERFKQIIAYVSLFYICQQNN